MQSISRNLNETHDFAEKFLAQLDGVKRRGATVVALYGDLGSGKTTFTQFLAKELGITNYVTSPTFVIEKRYPITGTGKPQPPLTPPLKGGEGERNPRLDKAGSRQGPGAVGNFKTLIHIDCYRLNDPKEMEILGWSEIVADSKNLIVVEWPERIEAILPKDSVRIEFEFVSESERKITQNSKRKAQK